MGVEDENRWGELRVRQINFPHSSIIRQSKKFVVDDRFQDLVSPRLMSGKLMVCFWRESKLSQGEREVNVRPTR